MRTPSSFAACCTATRRRCSASSRLGFLSLFPESCHAGSVREVAARRGAVEREGPAAGDGAVRCVAPYDSAPSSSAATPAARASRGRGGFRDRQPGPHPLSPPAAAGSNWRRRSPRVEPADGRVFVNRVWTHHFGHSSCRHAQRLRLPRDPPTHSECSTVAAEFMERARPRTAVRVLWKRLHKLIMMSASYTQQSLDRPKASRRFREPLLWKQNRRRLSSNRCTIAARRLRQPRSRRGGQAGALPSANRRAVYGYVDRLEFPSLLTHSMCRTRRAFRRSARHNRCPQALFLRTPVARTAAKKLLALPAIRGTRSPRKTRRVSRLSGPQHDG